LSSLTIGNSVKKFDYCAFSNCSSLKKVVIPGSVTEIGRSAFYKCSGLKSVEIPNSAQTIGLYAFYDCSSLTSITNHATIPQTINANVFTGVDKTKCKLNVWHESVDKYKKAEVWKDFLINDLGGVEGVEADAAAKEVEGYYDLRGIRLAEPSRGQVVIVRYTDGTARKIIVE
ncbi:MAG: leucine-rich repeat domain-containing protein, partial [Muribaculaceae bacterium]|nr:leucine-rich repeat domain-containing protein [Muribaculaceae bacterium]